MELFIKNNVYTVVTGKLVINLILRKVFQKTQYKQISSTTPNIISIIKLFLSNTFLKLYQLFWNKLVSNLIQYPLTQSILAFQYNSCFKSNCLRFYTCYITILKKPSKILLKFLKRSMNCHLTLKKSHFLKN